MVEQGSEGRERELVQRIGAAASAVHATEPARGRVSASELAAIRDAMDALAAEHARPGALDGLSADEAAELEARMAALHALAAPIAIAADDPAVADRYLAAAERWSRDDEQRAELACARRSPERYRALVHGRVLMARDRAREARATWRALIRGERGSDRGEASDAIARAASEELEAPRPLRRGERGPTLSRINGIGVGFYGRFKPWPDRSYLTLHCISVLWIPVCPLSGWRVRDANGGYQVFGREPLPRWAWHARWGILAAIALAIAVVAGASYLDDPDRLARQRWDAAIEAAHGEPAEAALRRIDDELARDLPRVDEDRAQRAGAEIVHLAASRVPRPLTTAGLDPATRVVRRYQALPIEARTGAAQAAMLDVLDAWGRDLGDAAGTAEARLALSSAAWDVAPAGRKPALVAQRITARLAVAGARQAEAPLEALAVLVDSADDARDSRVTSAADAIVERLAGSPSLLLDAGDDLDRWSAATSNRDARARVANLRKIAQDGRGEADAEGVTAEQLTAMAARRPWDQHVQLQLARGDASAGKLDGAAARLARLGAPGLTIREARLALAQLTAAQGDIDAADTMLTSLIAGRLARFSDAGAALAATGKQTEDRLRRILQSNNVPAELRQRVEAAPGESERRAAVSQWFDEQMKADAALAAARARYVALGDVVPAALASGSIKLRRAQALSGAARSAVLEDAERVLLAIRGAAEGQPEFRLALGETYARLGKAAESDAELGAVLADGTPALRLAVANVYRSLGNPTRTHAVAEQVFAAASGADKEAAAALLGQLALDQSHEDEAETWLRKAGDHPHVTASLLEIDADRLARQGKAAECAAKFAQIAKLHLANTRYASGYNNAALAYERGFDCSGDPGALRDAERTLETAYRNAPDEVIVVANLAELLEINGQLRVLARRINARALGLQLGDVAAVISSLSDGPERDALLAELIADPGTRRSAELRAQAEVLAPSSVRVLSGRFRDAVLRQDVAAASALVDRVRHATGLDVSEARAARERKLSGADDDKWLAGVDTTRARLEAILKRTGIDGLDARTRGAGWYLLGRALGTLGLQRADTAMLARAREAAATAAQLWPALNAQGLARNLAIDEAGASADAPAWRAVRRLREAPTALDRLVADHAPLADRIRGSAQWRQVIDLARADTSRPGVSDLRLARLAGDAALEARARAVLDNRLAHLQVELELLVDPGDEVARADLAYLDAR